MEIRSIGPFLDYFARIRERTLRVASCFTPETLEWRHAARAFSAGDTLRHLAMMERHVYVEAALRRPIRFPGHGPELAAGVAGVADLLRTTRAESVELLAGLTPEMLSETCLSPGGARLPSWKLLRAMIEHEIHHRGQLYVYLSLLGAPSPPIFGLTSEAVRAWSLGSAESPID